MKQTVSVFVHCFPPAKGGVEYLVGEIKKILNQKFTVHVDPEILIVDEILAVGDTEFQAKCFAKMEEFKKKEVTIIFVSHALTQVQTFCTRAIYLNQHQIQFDGNTTEATQKYLLDSENK